MQSLLLGEEENKPYQTKLLFKSK